jgi:hypothetical protein
MLDGFCKADPPTTKQLPVEANVPEFLIKLGLASGARKLDRAVGDLTLIAFYYLLRILGSTPPREPGTTQSKLRSLKWGT